MDKVVLANRIIRLVVNTLGFGSNVLTFVVFSRPAFQKNSISTFSQSSSLFFLLTNVIQFGVDFGNLFYGVYFPNLSDVSCKLYYWITVSLSAIIPWLLVTFSLDIILNMRRGRKPIELTRKKWFQWTLVAALVLFHLLLYLEDLILLKLAPFKTYSSYCTISTIDFYTVFALLYMLEAKMLPSVAMSVVSVMIYRMLKRSGQALERMGKISYDRRRRARDLKFAFSSLTFNILYILTQLPIVIYYVLEGYNILLGDYVYEVSLTLYSLYPAASILIHYVCNSIVRREIRSMMGSLLFGLKLANRVHVAGDTRWTAPSEMHLTGQTNPVRFVGFLNHRRLS